MTHGDVAWGLIAVLVTIVVATYRQWLRGVAAEKARCPVPLPDLNTIRIGMRVQLRPQLAAERDRGNYEPLSPDLSYREGARPISRSWTGAIQDFRLPLMVDEEVAASKGLLPAVSPFDRDGFSRGHVQDFPRDSEGYERTTAPVVARMVVSHEWQSTIEPPLDEDGWSRVAKSAHLRGPLDGRVEKSDANYDYVGAGTEYSAYPRGFGQTMFTILWDHGATTEEPAANLLRVMP